MIEGFGEGAGVEFWILGFFGVGKFGKYFFLLGGGARFMFGMFGVFKTIGTPPGLW